MWTIVVIAVLATALVAAVWVRQARHRVPPGKEPGADARREAHGSYWGGSAGGAI
jgi:hypothetical protein